MKALLAGLILPVLAFGAAAPPENWQYQTMDAPGGRVMDCEEKATLRRNGVNLTYSIHIPPTWVRLVDLPDRFIVIDEDRESVMVSNFIPEMAPVDITDLSDVVYFPVQVSKKVNGSIMARTTGDDYGIFYLLTDEVTMSWTCRKVPSARA